VEPPRILIADDQQDVLDALRLLLKSEGFPADTVRSPSALLKALQERDYSLVLMDMNYARDTTSGGEGLELLSRIQTLDATLPIVVMTGYGSIELAVECMRRGARDFITKPWDNARLIVTVNTQVELASTLRRSRRLEAENKLLRGESRGPRIVATSAAMQPVLAMIDRVGPSDASVLITGENGTGKGVVARALHAASLRREESFISVNMGGLPEGVFESELFGHVRGAFTDAKGDRAGRFELADGGTLFMDEIGNIPMTQQNKLLRTIETGEYEPVGSSRTRKVNVRLVSATNADLDAEIAAGRFRQDLFFRLNTIQIHLPALRERREDIPHLAEHFIRQHADRYRKPVAGLEPSALEALEKHPWPGNVREFDHAIERAVLMCPGRHLRVQDLALKGAANAPASLDDMSLEEVEAYLIRRTLQRCGGKASEAAEELGLSRSAFYRRLEKYGL
jgi:DNA-binding NtrC family response regulator